MQTTKLTAWLNDVYSLDGDITSELLRAYTNDVFLITAGQYKYVLKLYRINWRTESEIKYEVALLNHLAIKGLRVANPIAGKDGQMVYKMPAPNGEQYAVLFEYAAGKKPQQPFSDQLYYAFGQAIARMHELSDDFATGYSRSPLDLAFLIDAPLKLALPLIENEKDRLFLQQTAEKISHKIMELNARGLDWGPMHGDATLDNLHITDDNQIVLYDFDSGGPGWRASDLQGWAKNNDEYAEKWVAFKKGYQSIRELKAIDLEAAPYLAVAWMIWGLRIDLEYRILAQGSEKITAYLQEQLEAIRQQSKLALD